MNGIFINEKRHMLINSFIKILENKYIAYVTLVSFFGNLFFSQTSLSCNNILYFHLRIKKQ